MRFLVALGVFVLVTALSLVDTAWDLWMNPWIRQIHSGYRILITSDHGPAWLWVHHHTGFWVMTLVSALIVALIALVAMMRNN